MSSQPSTATIAALRPPAAHTARHRAAGLWRTTTVLGDLRRWAADTPDAVAIHADDRALTYAEYAAHVDRFAAALLELGVRPGDVVAVQLPNRWQVNAMMLACARAGAILAPILMNLGPRELERVLARLDAVACVTVDAWAGTAPAAALAEMAPRLPALRHRVVLGAHITDGEIDFETFFARTPRPAPAPLAEDDPDRVCVVLFTSGTSGEPKAVLHTFNTLYAGVRALTGRIDLGPDDVMFVPHAMTHALGLTVGLLAPLLTGAATVLLETWEPRRAVELLHETGATHVVAAAPFLAGLTAARTAADPRLPALRLIGTAGTTIPAELVARVHTVFGLWLRSAWAMTEAPNAAVMRADDPPGWATASDGSPTPAIELDLRGDGPEITPEQPARLYVRGAGVCLATLGVDGGRPRVLAEHDDGWYDTGDLVLPDGRDGIRMVGRDADRIGGAFIIPARDVETELLTHPGVADVALVGYPDDTGFELACAVVVAAGPTPPTLEGLRAHLTARGMTEWYQPSRLELVPQLPRNITGKVRKELLRRRLRGEAPLDAR